MGVILGVLLASQGFTLGEYLLYTAFGSECWGERVEPLVAAISMVFATVAYPFGAALLVVLYHDLRLRTAPASDGEEGSGAPPAPAG